MAALEHTKTGQKHRLDDPTVVGRSRRCEIQISLAHVSSSHAQIRWTGSNWELRDLDSRNGTFINGRRLSSGDRATLFEGAQLAFGDLTDPWSVVDDRPPSAIAVSDIGERQRADDNGLLVLPDERNAELGVYFDGTTWRADAGETIWPVYDGDTVEIQGKRWTLHLPEDLRATQEVIATSADMVLEFLVSQDEEHIELVVHRSGQQRRLDHRAHSYLLLTLARERLDQAQNPAIPESEQGWVYHNQLAEQLKLDQGHFNMIVYRARQQFSSLSLSDAGQIIERRRGSGQIRIGYGNLIVSAL